MNFKNVATVLSLAVVATACLVQPTKTDTAEEAGTKSGTASSSSSSGGSSSGSSGGSSSGSSGTTGDAGTAQGKLKLVVGGDGLKLKLNTRDATKITVPDDTGPEKTGYVVAIDLRSDQDTMITVCPDQGMTEAPLLKMSTVADPEAFPLEGAETNGGYETYGSYIKHQPKQSGSFLLHVYAQTNNLKDIGGPITLRAVVGGDLRCPGDHI